jgi:hypothetical protein
MPKLKCRHLNTACIPTWSLSCLGCSGVLHDRVRHLRRHPVQLEHLPEGLAHRVARRVVRLEEGAQHPRHPREGGQQRQWAGPLARRCRRWRGMSRRLNVVLFFLLLLLAASFHQRLSLGPEKDFGTDNGQAATGLLAVRGHCRCCSLGVRAVRVVVHPGVAATVFSCCVCRRHAEVHRGIVAGGDVRSSGGGADSGSRGVVVVVVSFAVVVVGVDNVAGTEVFPLVPATVVRGAGTG